MSANFHLLRPLPTKPDTDPRRAVRDGRRPVGRGAVRTVEFEIPTEIPSGVQGEITNVISDGIPDEISIPPVQPMVNIDSVETPNPSNSTTSPSSSTINPSVSTATPAIQSASNDLRSNNTGTASSTLITSATKLPGTRTPVSPTYTINDPQGISAKTLIITGTVSISFMFVFIFACCVYIYRRRQKKKRIQRILGHFSVDFGVIELVNDTDKGHIIHQVVPNKNKRATSTWDLANTMAQGFVSSCEK